jgi:hypothetical protein
LVTPFSGPGILFVLLPLLFITCNPNALPTLQNFLFVSKDEDAVLKVIDFGLSDFVRPGNMIELT